LRANDEREDYLRARFVAEEGPGLWVVPAERQDSSMLAVLAGAEALLRREPNAPALERGAAVEVLPLQACERLGLGTPSC
jgi:molybdopterin molybdotransferase